MRILTTRKHLFCAIALGLFSFYLKAQNTKNLENSDSKFDQLLSEKRKTSLSVAMNDRYKIQIFSGESEKAKREVASFKQNFKDIDATVIFNTPNYKVWVGNFKTRMEAERNLAEIKKKYKNILLIKPNK